MKAPFILRPNRLAGFLAGLLCVSRREFGGKKSVRLDSVTWSLIKDVTPWTLWMGLNYRLNYPFGTEVARYRFK